MTAPVLEVAGISNPAQYNYARIQDFGRYYYVTDWVNDGVLWIAHLKVDALATYKTAIGNSTQYLVRTSKAADPNIPDRMYSPTMTHEESQTYGTVATGMWDYSTGIYVIHQTGLFRAQGLRTDYAILTPTNFLTMLNALESDAGALISEDLFSRLLSAIWLPLNYTSVATNEYTKMFGTGFLNTPVPVTMKLVEQNTVDVAASITRTAPSWHNANRHWDLAAPYAEYTVEWFPWGTIPLDSVEVANAGGDMIFLRAKVDVRTGQSRLYVQLTDSSQNPAKIIHETVASLGVELPFHASSINGSALMSLLPQAVTTAAGIVAENPAMVAGGLGGMIGSVTEAVKGKHQVSGATGSHVSVWPAPRFTQTFYKPTDINYQEVGYPRCIRSKISSNTGYIVCATPYVALAGTESEKAEVYQYMTGGFFYE